MRKNRGIVIIGVIAVIVIIAFALLANRNTSTPAEREIEISEVGELTTRNLDNNYPNTPRKVVEFYSRITKCFYSEEYTEEQLKQLVSQSRKLMDAELLQENPEDSFFENTKKEIESFEAVNRVITSYIVEESKSIETYREGGAEYAIVSVKFLMKDNTTNFGKTYEDFLLRKDENGNWKILGWKLVPTSEKDEDE